MADFIIGISCLRSEKDTWEKTRTSLDRFKENVESIMNDLALSGSSAGSVKSMLKSCIISLENISKSTDQIKKAIEEVADNYQEAEQKASKSVIAKGSANDTKNVGTVDTDKTADSEEKEFIENYEYEYTEDNIAVPINIEFLDKNSCLDMADRIIKEHGEDGMCNGMDRKRIAKELYAHAIGYFFASELENMGIGGDLVQGTIESGEVADIGLGDGLDFHYDLVWGYFDPFKMVD